MRRFRACMPPTKMYHENQRKWLACFALRSSFGNRILFSANDVETTLKLRSWYFIISIILQELVSMGAMFCANASVVGLGEYVFSVMSVKCDVWRVTCDVWRVSRSSSRAIGIDCMGAGVRLYALFVQRLRFNLSLTICCIRNARKARVFWRKRWNPC